MPASNELKWAIASKQVKDAARADKVPVDEAKIKEVYIKMFAEGTPESVYWQDESIPQPSGKPATNRGKKA